jgi:hypothetical protein
MPASAKLSDEPVPRDTALCPTRNLIARGPPVNNIRKSIGRRPAILADYFIASGPPTVIFLDSECVSPASPAGARVARRAIISEELEMRKTLAAFGGVLLAASSAAFAQTQITGLGPANVIGGNGSYSGGGTESPFNGGSFPAGNILDTQGGDVAEPENGPLSYWLNNDVAPENDQDAFIVIDLGQAYTLTQVELFNTHNRQFNDRGTGDFTITGSNTIAPAGAGSGSGGSDIVGGTLLVSGTLAPATLAADPIDAQAFAVTDPGSYRYLRFDAETVAAGGNPCCGPNNYGLSEIRVFIPEPGTLGLMALGALGLLARRRRRL